MESHSPPPPPSASDFSYRTPERRPRIAAAAGLGRRAIHSPFSPMDVDSPSPPPVPPPAKKPLVSLFDWDDTLCPSSWLHRRGFLAAHGLVDDAPLLKRDRSRQGTGFIAKPLSRPDRRRLELLEDEILALLRCAADLGPVFIVTAATLHWVVASAEHFLPRVRQFLLDKQLQPWAGKTEQVQVVSAREWYHEHVGAGGDPSAWKTATFEAICQHLKVKNVYARLHMRTDLVSVGDARFEQTACVQMEAHAPLFLRSKTLKFVDTPSLDELLEQMHMTRSIYTRVCRYEDGLHLYVARPARRRRDDTTRRHQGEEWLGDSYTEDAAPTLQLVQIDRNTVMQDGGVREAEPADFTRYTPQYQIPTTSGGFDIRSNVEDPNEPPLLAVSGVRS
ncbi:hypothetical protein BBJ28_00000842 [Nothophytophthora sp. Chile5]|nr:hypothetical protein BBJ28_00000842 [Nothophytophthora sp. Chile5]